MTRLKPCVTVDTELYELVKELARAKWGIKQGNIKRYVEEAIKEKIDREKITPSDPLPIPDFTTEQLEAANKRQTAQIMEMYKKGEIVKRQK